MIKISRHGNGFKVAISEPGTGMRGYSVHARSMASVHNAVEHYYGDRVNENQEDCPLCNLEEKERTKRRRKEK